MTKSKYARFLVLLILVFLISFLFVILLDKLFISPCHELGHYLAGLALGIPITRVEWDKTYYIAPSDWRENVMGFSGGLFAVLILSLLYVIMYKCQKKLMSQTMHKRKRYFVNLILFFRVVVLADWMLQLTAGIWEGLNKNIYQQFVGNTPLLSLFTIIVTGLSFLIHITKTSEPIFEALLSKSTENTSNVR